MQRRDPKQLGPRALPLGGAPAGRRWPVRQARLSPGPRLWPARRHHLRPRPLCSRLGGAGQGPGGHPRAAGPAGAGLRQRARRVQPHLERRQPRVRGRHDDGALPPAHGRRLGRVQKLPVRGGGQRAERVGPQLGRRLHHQRHVPRRGGGPHEPHAPGQRGALPDGGAGPAVGGPAGAVPALLLPARHHRKRLLRRPAGLCQVVPLHRGPAKGGALRPRRRALPHLPAHERCARRAALPAAVRCSAALSLSRVSTARACPSFLCTSQGSLAPGWRTRARFRAGSRVCST